MEEWQQQAIEKNLVYLIDNTVCDSPFFAKLRSKGIINKSISDSLKATLKSQGNSAAAAELYELVPTSAIEGAYDKLIDALGNSGAAKRLKDIRDARALAGNMENPGLPQTTAVTDGAQPSKKSIPGSETPSSSGLEVRPSGRNYDFLSEIEKDILDFDKDEKKLSVVVKKPEKEMVVKDQYKLPTKNKGYLLLINIIEFDNPNLKTREGAEIDGRYMTELWTGLGYQVYTDELFLGNQTKCTKQDIKDLIVRFKAKCEKEGPASIIVYIGSHGSWSQIYTSDPQPDLSKPAVTLHLVADIVDKFNHQECPALANKPKIFIVQSCQGLERMREDSIPPSPYKDALIWTAQAPGFSAFRHPHKGSPFVLCLTYILMNFSNEMSLQEMIPMVESMTEMIRSGVTYGQTPTSTCIGLKELYFPLEPEENRH